MAQTSCPHCGAKLPQVVDAFCPECQSSLDAPPAVRAESDQNGDSGANGLALQIVVVKVIIGGLCLLFAAMLALVRLEWIEAIYTGVVGIALVVGGMIWSSRANPNRIEQQDAKFHQRRFLRRFLIVVGCLLMGATVVGVMRLWRVQPSTEVSKPGDYWNPDFGLRVQYGAEWKNVTTEARQRAKAQLELVKERSPVLLSLAWEPSDDQHGASVLFSVDQIPESESLASGAEYLRRSIHSLQQHPEPPREVQEEKQVMIGGFPYDRVSLKRSWGESEYQMTFWASLQKGHVIIVTGTYHTPEGLRAAETLLARVSFKGEN